MELFSCLQACHSLRRVHASRAGNAAAPGHRGSGGSADRQLRDCHRAHERNTGAEPVGVRGERGLRRAARAFKREAEKKELGLNLAA